jgi:hypothetical protein
MTITTGTNTGPAGIVYPAGVSAVIADVKAEVAKVETWGTKAIAFVQAHYAKVIALVIGFATSHFGLVSTILGKVL